MSTSPIKCLNVNNSGREAGGRPPIHFVFMTHVVNFNEGFVELKPNLRSRAFPLNKLFVKRHYQDESLQLYHFLFFELSVEEYIYITFRRREIEEERDTVDEDIFEKLVCLKCSSVLF